MVLAPAFFLIALDGAKTAVFEAMIVKGFIAAMTFSLAGFFGCSKPAAVSSAKAPQVAQSKIKDLGVLTMTNHYETCVILDKNRDCRIVPKILGRSDVQLTLTLESKGTDGKPAGLSVVELTGNPQKQFEVSIGDTDFTFTPQIAAN
jgi:hypothetical protein